MYNILMAQTDSSIALYIILAVVAIVIAVFFSLVPVRIWFRALVSGSYISMGRLIGMKLRKVDISLIVNAYIKAKKAGLTFDIDEMETHYMAGGEVDGVVNALIAAHSAKIALTVDAAKAIDLAGRNIEEAVRFSVNPKVIDIPKISAIAKDGIELKVSARVTVRTNIGRLVGGAGEDTIIARIGEGIVTTVGSALYHEDVLENPDKISKTVLEKGLDDGTAYEILSIDMADIDVGDNIGARLMKERAEADKTIAQAKAEERKSMAVALEQEMRAKTQEMRAMLVAAEADVPKAMADAFRKGNLGIMDYYKMQNVVSDTAMRNSIAGVDDGKVNTTK